VPAGARTNSFNRSSNHELPLRSKDREQNFIQSDFSLRSPPVIRPSAISLPKAGKELKNEAVWEGEKNRFRDEIDGNKEKIQEL
jgi:hypothetical protein